jgi:hypothetical protein
MDIHTNKSQREVREILGNLRALFGGADDRYGFAETFYSAVAYSLLDSAYVAAVRKSVHVADDLGETWEPLSPRTIAYKKPSFRKGKDLPGPKLRPTLTPVQDATWRLLFVSRKYQLLDKSIDLITTVARARQRAISTLNLKKLDRAASAEGAKLAWNTVKKRFGAETLINLAKSAVHTTPILKETGNLLESLSPGAFTVPYTGHAGVTIVANHKQINIKPTAPYAKYVFDKRTLWPKEYTPWRLRAYAFGKQELIKQIASVLS